MNGVVKLNGLFDRPEIQPGHERVYTQTIGRYSDLTLRFSKSVSRPLPRTLAALRKVLSAVYLPLAASDPESADGQLALEWRPDDPKGWKLGIAETTDRLWIPGSFPLKHGADGSKNVAKARQELEFILQFIEVEWLAHRRALWITLISAERIANQHMALHLMRSEERLEEVKDDYVGLSDLIDKFIVEPADRIRALTAVSQSPRKKKRFMSLVAALVELREMRGTNDLEALLRQRSVLGAAATMASLLPVMVAAGISPSAPEAIEDLKSLASDTNQRAMDALLSYVAKMRALAAEHPILTVLHHISERSMSESSIQQSVMNAVKAVSAAIEALASVMDTPVIPPLDSKGIAPGATAMVEAIADVSKLSIWKLPMFVDRALLELPEEERLSIQAMRETAFERKKEELAVRELVMSVVETGAMLIPAARVAGLVLSLAVGLARLTGTIKSYEETTTLYHASLDPGFLALGDIAHAPADADMMVFDLAAVALDVVGVGKAARAF
jgi:hypothetical protein